MQLKEFDRLNDKIKSNDENFTVKEKKDLTVYYFFKRIFDIIFSILGLLILSPFLIIVSIIIKLDSKGPVLFSQDRVGKNGKIFRIYKFRSMCEDAEDRLHLLRAKNEKDGPIFKIEDDPRITGVGKFIRRTSIDELPQLYNILMGDMSFVGPRPSLPNEVKQYNSYQMQRITIKPGLTCYWQVLGRSNLGFDDWVDLDIKYIREQGYFTDFKILFKTIGAVIKREGAY